VTRALKAAESVLTQVRLEVFRVLLMQPIAFYDRHSTTEISNSLAVDLETVRSATFGCDTALCDDRDHWWRSGNSLTCAMDCCLMTVTAVPSLVAAVRHHHRLSHGCLGHLPLPRALPQPCKAQLVLLRQRCDAQLTIFPGSLAVAALLPLCCKGVPFRAVLQPNMLYLKEPVNTSCSLQGVNTSCSLEAALSRALFRPLCTVKQVSQVGALCCAHLVGTLHWGQCAVAASGGASARVSKRSQTSSTGMNAGVLTHCRAHVCIFHSSAGQFRGTEGCEQCWKLPEASVCCSTCAGAWLPCLPQL
jgi:hypothetical protein